MQWQPWDFNPDMFDSKAPTFSTGIMNAYQDICAIFQVRKLSPCDKPSALGHFSFTRAQSRNKIPVPVAQRMKVKSSLVPRLAFDAHNVPGPDHLSEFISCCSGRLPNRPCHFFASTPAHFEAWVKWTKSG